MFYKASKSVVGSFYGRNHDQGFGFDMPLTNKMLRPIKLDRNTTVILKKRQSKLMGRNLLTRSKTGKTYSFASDPSKQNLYTLRRTQDVGINQIPSISHHEVNTETIDFTSSGMRHVEGGWPKDVSLTEEDQKLRFRKKIEKDEYFIHSVLQLSTKMEHCIKQNSAIDIYEGYFNGFEPPIIDDNEPVKIVNVIRDPSEGRMITDLSFSTASTTKIAAAYSSFAFMGLSQDDQKESYIWDINTSSRPDSVLRGPSWLQCIQYNPKDPNIVGAGCLNGQISYWDVRTGAKPQDTTSIKVSHEDTVTSLSWLVYKTKYELFTVSTDGWVIWWDTRKFSEPTDKLQLLEQETNMQLTATSLEHEPSMPTKFMVGTEQGKIVACNRRARNAADRIGLSYNAHLTPVYSVQRNPLFQKNFLSVGDWTLKVWTEDFKESPILWTSPSSSQLRSGCWSPTRASTAFTTSATGVLQIWDFLESWTKPSVSVQVVDEALESVIVDESGRMVAIGSEKGTVSLARLPERLYAPFNKHEKPAFTALLERETRRERVLESRHKEQRLREKAKGALIFNRRDAIIKLEADPTEEAEQEYHRLVEQLKAQLAIEEEAIVEVTPAPDERSDSEDDQDDKQNMENDEPQSFSSGEIDR